MDFRAPTSMNKKDLLSLAQKISNSKLLNRNLIKTNSGVQLKNPQVDTLKKSNLIYSNIVQNKERSRSVNAMMNSLIKQSEVLVKPTKGKGQENKINKIIDLNTSFESNGTGSDNLSIKDGNNNINNSLLTPIANQNHRLSFDCIKNDNDNLSKFSKNEDTYSCKSYSPITPIETHFTNPYQQKMYLNILNSQINQIKFNQKANAAKTGNTKNNKDNVEEGHSNIKENNANDNFHKKTESNNGLNNEYIQQSEENIITIIQLEDLIVLEEKLYHILDSFRYGKPGPKLCVEWWTFYIYSSFCGKFESLFNNPVQYKQIAHTTSNLELLCIILIYEALKDSKITQNTINILKNMSNEIHQNFLVVIDLILTKITTQSMTNIWINKIQNIIISKRVQRFNRKDHMNIIKKKNDYLSTIFKSIISTYSGSNKIDVSSLNFFFKQLNKIPIKSLNDYFRKKINLDYCKTGDSLTFIISETPVMPNIPVPYLPQNIPLNQRKKFTLVIDLDETLISFKSEEKGRGLLRLRPGINEFLTNLKPLYELILFTAGTQDYADRIVDSIEQNQKFFDKRLYRQHAIIIDNVFVKDLSKLGRDLSKVIIIDNMPHNFRLQKENGIFIKNFYGEDKNDTALIDLIPILESIASDPENDVRVELKRWRKEIFAKITTNLKDENS